jgi:hypothetical protein
MGQYETSTGMKEIGVISGKTSPPRLELQNDVFIGTKYSCKGFQNRV